MSKQQKRKKLYEKASNIIRNNVDKSMMIYKVTKSNAGLIIATYNQYQRRALKRRRQRLFIMAKKNELLEISQ